jgi:lysophospholipase L1-like esterase
MELSSRAFERFFTYVGYIIFSFVVAAIVLELGAATVFFLVHRIHPDPVADPVPRNPAYSRYPWAQDLRKEERLRLDSPREYAPFRVWGLPEWHGQYMNNDATKMGVVRRTVNLLSPDCKRRAESAIWIFGGSAVYGVSVPDWATLPSYLSHELNAAGSCTEVTNFGVEGYVSSQELIVLLEELKLGWHPDIVIFYDGFNDSFVTAVESQIAGAHMGLPLIKARIDGSLNGRFDFLTHHSRAVMLSAEIVRFLHRKRSSRQADSELSSPGATIENFEQNLRIARALAETYHFKVYGFWQPAVVYGNKRLAPFEQFMADHSSIDSETPFQAMIPVYQEAQLRAATAGDFVFLGNVFDAVEEPVYLDWVHLNPMGNQIVARVLAQSIESSSVRSASENGLPRN